MQARVGHATLFDQLCRTLLITFGPGLRVPRPDDLHGALVVQLAPDAVDPTEGDHLVQDVLGGYKFVGYVFLERHQPDVF